MSTFLSFTVIGIVTGAVYAITATGLVVTYSTTGVFNFAHGAVSMVAAFSFYQCWVAWGWPWWLSLIIIVLIGAPLLGAVVELSFMRRLHGATVERSLMITIGLMLILRGIAQAIWDPATLRPVDEFILPGQNFSIFGVVFSYQDLSVIVVAALIAVGLRLYLRGPRSGVALRAVVDDPELLAMAGAAPHRIARRSWMLGFALAAIAGVFVAPSIGNNGLQIDTLTMLVVNGYAAAVVGRLRSLPWTFAGGIMLGLANAYAVGYLPGHLPASLVSTIDLVIPVVFLFVVLLVLPASRLVAAGRLTRHAPPRVATARQSLSFGVLGVALAVVLSLVTSGTWTTTLTQGLALGIVGLSSVLLTGYAGQVSLAQYSFMGFGAFWMGKAANGGGSWIGLVAAIAFCALLGALIALPAIRLRGLYLALATLAFSNAAIYGFFSNSSIFPGYGAPVAVGRLTIPGLSSISDATMLIEAAVAFALCAGVVLWVRRATFGRRLVALSDSPAAFAGLGLTPAVSKVIVFAVSGAIAGIGGVIYGGQQGGISANDVQLFSGLVLLLLVSIIGLRTATGALIGGIAAASLPVLTAHLPGWTVGLPGAAVGVGINILAFHPDGVMGIPWLNARFRLPFGDQAFLIPQRDRPELSLAN